MDLVRRKNMSEKSSNEAATVSFREKLTSSQAFSALFRDGMTLVEETAAYLDGPGRKESKELSRAAALAYATESMRLTTRLMQLASWLLLHRAVKEGEMSLAQVNQEKTKVRLSASEPASEETLKMLPATLADLICRSRKLLDQVRRLDATMHNAAPALVPDSANPVSRQLGLLKAAFERHDA
jgi:regulator of CtrA degradation